MTEISPTLQRMVTHAGYPTMIEMHLAAANSKLDTAEGRITQQMASVFTDLQSAERTLPRRLAALARETEETESCLTQGGHVDISWLMAEAERITEARTQRGIAIEKIELLVWLRDAKRPA